MKEFVLTQPYANLNEMIGSGEVAVYKEELEQGTIEEYAIVSRIGNRYNIKGEKIIGFEKNPYFKKDEVVIIKEEKENFEVKEMKYPELEAFVDEIVAKKIDEVKVVYEEKIAKLKEEHIATLVKAKEEAKVELIAKLNS
jgi:hypothetical protein